MSNHLQRRDTEHLPFGESSREINLLRAGEFHVAAGGIRDLTRNQRRPLLFDFEEPKACDNGDCPFETVSTLRVMHAERKTPDPTRVAAAAIRRIFLLSPAKVSGVRAGYLLRADATFALARQLHERGLPLAEIFSFASGLYFRGKITYARRFADPALDLIRVITANAGLVEPERILSVIQLRRYGRVDIRAEDPRFTRPLRRDALKLAASLVPRGQVILLGSIATTKYRETLVDVFGSRLVVPKDFVGRGDMSRGGLLLRAVRDGRELPYIPVVGATLTGKRAPRLDPSAR